MESGRLFFDPSACKGNMLFLGNGDSIFQGSRTMMMNMEESSRRRPFFSSPDELFDDEYYDEQLPEKKRRLTSEQVHMLEKSFEVENKLEPERKSQLAKNLGLQPRQVAVWFQNRRARWKTKQLERDYDLLKSSYDSLLSDYESTLKDNDKLKSEVISLTEKVQAKELGTGGQEYEALVAVPPGDAQMMSIKLEDSGGSGVVDEDGPQIVDSGDSCFPNPYPNEDYDGCMAMAAADEEDDGSDDGQSYYLSHNAFAQHQNNNEEGEPLHWWVWS